MNNPLVSIICICKNRKEYIRQCIESVLKQDYENFEFLIQDGASTDGTVEIIREYQDDRIKLISEPDSGPGEAFVNVLKRIQGDIWGSCLSDEEMLPQAISWAVHNFRQYPAAAAIYGDAHIIDETGKIIQSTHSLLWNFERYLCSEIVPPFSASFFRTESFNKIGYDRYNDCGEFDIWLRLGSMFQINYIPCYLANFRRHATSDTSTTAAFYKTLQGRIRAIEKITSDPETPEYIRSLKYQALAGLHLWVAENFITHGHIQEAGKMIVTALDYAPRQERLVMICRAFAAAAGIDALIGGYKPVMDAVAQHFETLEQQHSRDVGIRGEL
ncbi:MAG: hypothetical protein A2X83_12025 [Desulfuromonadales bacterium GWD2_54_10]|nr:MAG: hypothetical protein A2X83_12025 [Desulfuromonadales bacterium GWD2_54_10]